MYSMGITGLLHRFLGRNRYKRFAVLAHARTGSNFLLTGLSQLGCVRMHHEVFAGHNRTMGENFHSILSDVFKKEPPGIKAVGFKVFYYHLTTAEWARMKDLGITWIHLTRLNRLRTIVSLEIASATDQWTATGPRDGHTIPRTIRLDPETLVDRIRWIGTMENEARRLFRGQPVLECTYEDLTRSPGEEFGRILDFLGIAGRIDPASIDLVRQNPQPLTTLIENHGEVARVLRTTDFAGYLAG